MKRNLVYVGLGGNIGDSSLALCQALEWLRKIDGVFDLLSSDFYETTPVECLCQDPFVNAVCSFDTTLSPSDLFCQLQRIEKKMGRGCLKKNAPRIVDLDILFYGDLFLDGDNLKVPHPRFKERLFVLRPLMDLTDKILVPTGEGVELLNLSEYLKDFPNIHHETVKRIPFTVPLKESVYEDSAC